jgi:hypothetical protein
MRTLVFALLLPAALPSAARAQNACADVAKFFAHPPKIGEWAEIAWEKKGDEKGPDRMRMAAVGTERREGKQLYRLQMEMTDDKGKHSIIQMLTPWDVGTVHGGEAVEVVMKMEGQPAMKMGGGMMRHSPASQTDWREFCSKSTFVGEESVTVPAGTFKARHYKGPDGDTWASLDAPVWHIVKMTTKDGKTMVLSGKGTGAKNEITETPVDMKAMMANPEAMKKMQEEMNKKKSE